MRRFIILLNISIFMILFPLYAAEPLEIAGLFDFLDSGKDSITNLNPAQGQSYDNIHLTWKTECKGCNFIIYRSIFEKGPFKRIGKSNFNDYIDEDAEPGIKYWYRVDIGNGSEKITSNVQFGYRRLHRIKGVNFDKEMNVKIKKRPVAEEISAQNKEEKDLKALDKYVTNSIKLSFILYIGKKYIKDGSVTVLKNFDSYHFDYHNRMVYLMKNKKCFVKFYSKKIYRMFKHIKKNIEDSDRLIRRLMKNLHVYCIYLGEIEKKLKNGSTMYINYYEAAGLSTEYFKEYINWNSNTIMIGSSNKKIIEMVRKAQNY